MTQKTTWEEFFDLYAHEYLENDYTKNTQAEVDFLIEELGLVPGMRVLDVGCGVGRHSVELARRGMKVTGIDISAGMLEEAQKHAENAGVKVEFIKSNAAEFKDDSSFDVAICLCEGAFSLIEHETDPIPFHITILENICRALKPGGYFLLTCLNGMNSIRHYSKEDIEKGTFDPLTITNFMEMELDTPEGKKKFIIREKRFIPPELKMLFHMAGLTIENIWGGTAGNWGKRSIDPDEMEIMVKSRK